MFIYRFEGVKMNYFRVPLCNNPKSWYMNRITLDSMTLKLRLSLSDFSTLFLIASSPDNADGKDKMNKTESKKTEPLF